MPLVREPAGEDIRSQHTPDGRLAEALRPAVAAALLTTVRDEPRLWAEVLFPVLLPAVRIAVSSALRNMVHTLNQVLAQGLSLRSWKWRVEAWRTGKTFAEVVLLRTLVFRVEQLLLVDRRAGLLLASVAAPEIIVRDQQQICAMLTALQDFVSDSFAVNAADGIRELHIDDFTLLVEVGPKAALAAAVRGTPPAEVRETLRAAIDLIHQEFAAELQDFRDDAGPFDRATTILDGCLQAQYRDPEAPSYTRVWVFAAVILVALFAWIWSGFADAKRWVRAVTALRGAQGIVITRSDRGNGRYVVEGLRDPLAGRPETLLENSGIDLRRVTMRFEPYLSLDPELVARRARMVLDAPATILISHGQGVLKLRGDAAHSWILQAMAAGPKLAFLGIRTVEAGDVRDQDMELLRAEIESGGVLFDVDSSQFIAEQLRAGKTLAAKSRQWVDLASGIGRAPRLMVFGYADPTGTEERNEILSRRRAERLKELLEAAGIAPGLLLVGDHKPSTDAPAVLSLQRRAVIRLSLQPGVRSAW